MADSKDSESFFRKVVRFVANPATDWADLGTKVEDSTSGGELEKSELKAMIERKRRNDFVRKREFDMLRRVRREGLSPEQVAQLGTPSRSDDSEARASENAARADGRVKAKIDEIEQQMVGDSYPQGGRRPGAFFDAPTEPAVLPRNSLPSAFAPGPGAAGARSDTEAGGLPALPPLPDLDAPSTSQRAALASRPGALPPMPAALGAAADFANPFALEVSEVVHDPELDEAVISFANADFTQCEQSLTQLTGPGGARAQHAETWLVLFDLYRATGQQPRFENLALDYARQFGWSAPQWYSLPKLVADAAAAAAAAEPAAPARVAMEIGWVCPSHLDTDGVARLRSQTLQMPLPWVMDWAALRQVDAEAATQLAQLLRSWAAQALEMRWLNGQVLLDVLHDAAPTGVRDADPSFWLTRLEVLRLANRATEFDETAIDYCVTYEVSPPSWEAARCNLRLAGANLESRGPLPSMVGDASTGFVESALLDDADGGPQVASVELSGQLVGDISETLRKLDEDLGLAPMIHVSCSRLIRVDFIAAGDLLNWVLVKRSQQRSVQFAELHRLLALFFGAMGINEHARVQVRQS